MAKIILIIGALMAVVSLSRAINHRGSPFGRQSPPTLPPNRPRYPRMSQPVNNLRSRRDVYEQPSYLDEQNHYEPSPRLRRFSVPIVVVPMPAPPPPPPMA